MPHVYLYLLAGRYAVNNPTFDMGSVIDITQENLRFQKHQVLLDGGISMVVEGLLTYQVVDVVGAAWSYAADVVLGCSDNAIMCACLPSGKAAAQSG